MDLKIPFFSRPAAKPVTEAAPSTPTEPASTPPPEAKPAGQPQGSSFEPTEVSGARRAAQQQVSPQANPAQRAFAAAGTMYDVKNGIESRYIKLNKANGEVAKSETQLAQQLNNLAPSMTKEQRQAYADAYRKQHASTYHEASEAAEDLAKYMQKNVSTIQSATDDLKGHPYKSAVANLPHDVNGSIDEASRSLETFTKQSPTPNHELQETLHDLGSKFSAAAAQAGTPDPEAGKPGHGPSGAPLTVAGKGIEAMRLAGRMQDIAEHAGHAFGIAGAGLALMENGEKILGGEARTEHYVGAAANVAEIAGGVAAVAGVKIGAPIAAVGAAIGLGAEAVSAYRDRQEYVEGVKKTLTATGSSPERAEALARSNPDSLAALQKAGYSPQQIADIAEAAPVTVRIHRDQTHGLIAGGQKLGLSADQVTRIAKQLGSPAADVAFNSMMRVMSANPGISKERLIQRLQQGFDANPMSQRLATMLQGQ